MLYKDIKMEKRSDDEPKFNSKNKTDRKILLTVIIVIAILLVILGGLIALYYAFFYLNVFIKHIEIILFFLFFG